jgi:hypothetical protein
MFACFSFPSVGKPPGGETQPRSRFATLIRGQPRRQPCQQVHGPNLESGARPFSQPGLPRCRPKKVGQRGRLPLGHGQAGGDPGHLRRRLKWHPGKHPSDHFTGRPRSVAKRDLRPGCFQIRRLPLLDLQASFLPLAVRARFVVIAHLYPLGAKRCDPCDLTCPRCDRLPVKTYW